MCALANSGVGLLRPSEKVGRNGNGDTTMGRSVGFFRHPNPDSELGPSMEGCKAHQTVQSVQICAHHKLGLAVALASSSADQK